ncbi:MAG TPA: RNA polymerase sigma factor [Saprospiraceae bacterium]|nr:RNA polymerase sigma factor [Saprospiraceae bacterium]HMQ81864.1 RNA polymerase sigma factor [Saprospiraceae bacterium]
MNSAEFQNKYHQLSDLLFAFAMRLTRNMDDAKDLLQETACKAYQHKERFQLGTNFKAWMTTIMRNTFINAYRKSKTRNTVESPIEEFLYAIENKATEAEADAELMATELFAFLGQLSDTYRIPFLLHFQGYQYWEIAEELDIPIGTVKSRIHSARQNLQKAIAAHPALYEAAHA